MVQKIYDFVKKYQMLSKDDYVVAGVSGGADSVCLLLVLNQLRKQIGFEIKVVHINHQIREEAIEDENFVIELCSQLQIPYTIVRKDVEAIAKTKHMSTEEAGREVRYQAFFQELQHVDGKKNGKIAIAHNKNDSAETFLFHLFRGSGIQGLTGILPIRDCIIRPLLVVSRPEIEQYLKNIGQEYCIDKTNLEDDYARNRIRHHIVDYANREICNTSVEHIQDAAEMIQNVVNLLDRLSAEGYAKCCMEQEDDSIFIKEEEFFKIDHEIHGYIILKAFSKIMKTKKDIAKIHVDDTLNLFNGQSGKKIDLPYGIEACREYNGVLIRKRNSTKNSEQIFEEIFLEPELNRIKAIKIDDEIIIEYGVFDYQPGEIIPQKTYTKWFDYDKIIKRLSIRKRMANDYLCINEGLQKKSLKAYFINEKVPREEREKINLLVEGNHILWIIGSRISTFYKVGKDTKRILKVNLRGGFNNGPES